MKVSYFALITLVMGCMTMPRSSSAGQPEAPPDSGEYRIGVEDVLDIAVWEHPTLQRVVPVRPDGKISLPLVNDVVAANLTAVELRQLLMKEFAVYVQRPDVSVVVREIHSFKVSVIGNVKKPGRYELKGPATVLDVLALAEGFTEFAGRRHVTILRKNGATSKRIHFNYESAVSNGAGETNIVVRPGDIIIVP